MFQALADGTQPVVEFLEFKAHTEIWTSRILLSLTVTIFRVDESGDNGGPSIDLAAKDM